MSKNNLDHLPLTSVTILQTEASLCILSFLLGPTELHRATASSGKLMKCYLIMPRAHLHVKPSPKSHARRFSRKRAGHRPRNSHVNPVRATHTPYLPRNGHTPPNFANGILYVVLRAAFTCSCEHGISYYIGFPGQIRTFDNQIHFNFIQIRQILSCRENYNSNSFSYHSIQLFCQRNLYLCHSI